MWGCSRCQLRNYQDCGHCKACFSSNPHPSQKSVMSAIQSSTLLGAHCSCYNVASVSPDHDEIDVPFGCEIVRWDVVNHKRMDSFAGHKALISDMKHHSKTNRIATCSYDCNLCIWNTDYKLLSRVRASDCGGPIARISWSLNGDYLCTVTKHSDSTFCDSELRVFTVDLDSGELTLSAKIVGNYRFATFNRDNYVVAWNIQPNCIEMLTPNHLKFITSLPRLTDVWNCAMVIDETHSTIVCATTNRKLLVVDAASLKLLKSITTDATPGLWNITFYDSEHVLLSPCDGKIALWNIRDGQCVTTFNGPSDFVYVLHLDPKREYLYVCTDGLRRYNIKACLDTKITSLPYAEKRPLIDEKSIQYHSIACCGIDVSSDGRYIAVGDLGCNFIIWDRLSDAKTPIVCNTALMSIRSVKWIPQTNIVLIGLITGELLAYAFDPTNPQPSFISTVMHSCPNAINTIEYQFQYSAANADQPSVEKVYRVACGTSGGEIYIFDLSPIDTQKNNSDGGAVVEIVDWFKWLAHPPVHSDDAEYKQQFGSIHRAADIWSCVWSPNADLLATSSEDQTTRIWSLPKKNDSKHTPSMIAELTGHSSAVTCVDWTIIDGSELIATCADDRTIMLWKHASKDSFELVHVFNPKSVLGWFTFTYLRFMPHSTEIVAGTENGYVAVVDAVSFKELDSRCLHRGSIEGLECHRKGFALTAASDGTVGVHSFQSKL